ncbi:hypothetical protein PIB30_009018 [Stylosanthes scabra]|uniref:Uncharacterized protein n=1 Tax=Stylosanthes scabra TaxID=79078 RepID=A0ABU6T4Y3_9FABA|nr:hypothetical protein [Stylosanthes scabra]
MDGRDESIGVHSSIFDLIGHEDMPRFKCGEVMKPVSTAEFGAEVAEERAKGTKGSQQNLEGHCWTRCVRINEGMRTHPIRGRHAQKAVSAQMRTHSELLCVRISGSQIVPVTTGYSWEPGAESRTPSNSCSKSELNPELRRPQGIRDFPNYNERKSPPRASVSPIQSEVFARSTIHGKRISCGSTSDQRTLMRPQEGDDLWHGVFPSHKDPPLFGDPDDDDIASGPPDLKKQVTLFNREISQHAEAHAQRVTVVEAVCAEKMQSSGFFATTIPDMPSSQPPPPPPPLDPRVPHHSLTRAMAPLARG